MKIPLLPKLAALLLLGALSTSAARAQGKPPATGSLYEFQGTLNLAGLVGESGGAFSIGNLKDGRPAIKVDFPASKGYPGISFPSPKGGWDLSEYGGIAIDISNPGENTATVYLRAENQSGEANPWSVELARINKGETKTLKVAFGKAFGSSGFALDKNKVSAIRLYVDPPKAPYSVLVTNLRAYKSSAAAPEAPKVAAGATKPYPTTTVSPTDHTKPYGLNLVLVKDWTFGKNRADATIKTREDLDREFYYRYIYDKGRLDTLATYWSVHRDYPDDSPKNLHVFGDQTLTLKGRIPEGGGLRKGGIESGMLRSKFNMTPGMYVEMRAKLTKGIGVWPSFWLNPGVQYPDGTFSKLGWPPEIDIFEFFNWQGREKTRELAVNIQVNNHPERFGNPYAIFSAMNKDNEYVPGMDFSEDFHVFALDWHKDRPIWILDGHPIKQVYYEWGDAAPAHILITNQIGIEFAKDAMKQMTADESNWNYEIDYIRVWERK
jgi:hypothetical protein